MLAVLLIYLGFAILALALRDVTDPFSGSGGT
jgi:hypothetical protein